ncbi:MULTISPECIES: metalloregulator ArsR/SmtB family transcription factor [Acidobacterium]|uniref:ArsR family transcriptional regulatory protein n=1 Tax=Acidobacterium capsulatum (strain ATCC 51196 / DSM 11244 / BCRC 80197 / JCM 7670 / NBRC 15755 / NCIMB 13165 / 161) TaxID=240015 RepID=C1F1F0_ACIC5|nr:MULTISPECIES: metalloregulator ArsR/SmtB family transcription factor [Acidobacterium]ACO33413.1 ArsR family transcriptional regulatory protein [Acidobacterium capsulatum ATCC 51196]
MASTRPPEFTSEQMTRIAKAIGDPRRFEIFQRIAAARQQPTCGCLLETLPISAATLSHHLKELEQAGLIAVEREGKFAHLSLRRDTWAAYLKQLSKI